MASNSEILATIRVEQPQLSGIDDARITSFIAEARDVWVVNASLTGTRLDTAIKYKALSLLQISLSSSASGGSGVKKEKAGAVEREYFDNAAAAQQFLSRDFEGLFRRALGFSRKGPWVTGSGR